MGILNSVASSVRKRFFDTFSSRTDTTGSLGTASDGSFWNAVSKVIQVTTGAAKATTTPVAADAGTNYPIATQIMPTQDNIIDLSGTNEGSAIAIWVQSSSDWWMVNVEGTQNTVPNYSFATNLSYNYAYQYSTSTSSNSVTYYTQIAQYSQDPSYTSATFPYVNTFYASGTNYYVTTVSYQGITYSSYQGGSTFASYKTGTKTNYSSTAGSKFYVSYAGGITYGTQPPGTYYSAAGFSTTTSNAFGINYFTGAPYSFSTYSVTGSNPSTYFWATSGPNSVTTSVNNYYTYVASYSTVYNEYLKIKQSASSVVSTISSALISTAQTIASLRVITSGNQITARAYSDNFITQIGSDLVYTATGATLTTQYGIAVSPSAYNQSAIIGTSVNISRN